LFPYPTLFRSVVEEHVAGGEGEADEAGDDARAEGTLAERRGHRLGLLGLELDRQRAVAQGDGERLGGLPVERPRDLDLVALEVRHLDRRGRQDLVVEDDRELALPAADVRAGRVAGVAAGGDLVELVDAVLTAAEHGADGPLALGR